jgi:hypothetical protein
VRDSEVGEVKVFSALSASHAMGMLRCVDIFYVNETAFQGSWAAIIQRGARGAAALGTDLAHSVAYSNASHLSSTLHAIIEKDLNCPWDVYYSRNVRPRGLLLMSPCTDATLWPYIVPPDLRCH